MIWLKVDSTTFQCFFCSEGMEGEGMEGEGMEVEGDGGKGEEKIA